MNTEDNRPARLISGSFPQLVATLVISAVVAGCSFTVTENRVTFAEIRTKEISASQAFGGVTSRLVAGGYDIKHSDRDAGVVISEYRAVAQSAGNPPFDTYLQFRTTIQEGKDGVTLRFTPAVKSQNRLNLLASSEVPLLYYTGDPKNVSTYVRKHGRTGITVAYSAFEAVINDMANLAKVPVENVNQPVQSRTIKSR
ncbi:MAG: hypothetical protein LC687_05075 [Actinobacteria bacterium]|nr:hypothetical protein [Actinomycetota bacterium]